MSRLLRYRVGPSFVTSMFERYYISRLIVRHACKRSCEDFVVTSALERYLLTAAPQQRKEAERRRVRSSLVMQHYSFSG